MLIQLAIPRDFIHRGQREFGYTGFHNGYGSVEEDNRGILNLQKYIIDLHDAAPIRVLG